MAKFEMNKGITLIKEVILEAVRKNNVKIDKIILFGSRARGDYREDSDYDILVITKEKLDWRIRKKVWLDIIRKIPFRIDLIIIDRETFEERAKYVGNVLYEAKIEGKTIWTERSG